ADARRSSRTPSARVPALAARVSEVARSPSAVGDATSAGESQKDVWPNAAAPIVEPTASAAERSKRVPMFMAPTLPLESEPATTRTCVHPVWLRSPLQQCEELLLVQHGDPQ